MADSELENGSAGTHYNNRLLRDFKINSNIMPPYITSRFKIFTDHIANKLFH